ncbi:hypothetical protein [Sphingobium yanoikuyae]|jgi:hypothetical protein|uniref:hypothetical protein n=1 Tax=Sphingobium yanoikuyae TaxID=13690 RepID=UPI0028ABC64D|nr:hypothetical protein [Sphingobium yanoikuyae]
MADAVDNPYEIGRAFALDFGRAEYALKRSKYLRKNKEIAEADWEAFARDLGAGFFADVVAKGMAKTLIGDPPRRLMADMTWSPEKTAPLTNVHQLMIEGVCRVRNSLLHGEKFTGGPVSSP